ncbi:unnamed protein product [Peniophora sp. CBMAI 1063]|nr:unnamed protein product [Peniophora sp. CBMAI 1063]
MPSSSSTSRSKAVKRPFNALKGIRSAQRYWMHKEIAEVDAKWHTLARSRHDLRKYDEYSGLEKAELEAAQKELVWREVHQLRLTRLPQFDYMWQENIRISLEAYSDGNMDFNAIVAIERYKRLWNCLEQEASATASRSRKRQSDEEYAAALSSVLLKHRMSQEAATNDFYGRFDHPNPLWLDPNALSFFLGPDAPQQFKALEHQMCFVSEVQRFRDASYFQAESDVERDEMLKIWFRGFFIPRREYMQEMFDYADACLRSLEGMDDGAGNLMMSAAMWLHEHQTNGKFKISPPSLRY